MPWPTKYCLPYFFVCVFLLSQPHQNLKCHLQLQFRRLLVIKKKKLSVMMMVHRRQNYHFLWMKKNWSCRSSAKSKPENATLKKNELKVWKCFWWLHNFQKRFWKRNILPKTFCWCFVFQKRFWTKKVQPTFFFCFFEAWFFFFYS